ncbi:MAG: hypothetical protein L0H79_01750 [Intrasporangium sp.]|uniref:lipopolysaccharide biosynthesis protein n=1 Tax=Intrasporangium sp. TaxID=1925024 RepID=UPI002648C590|nr:hypothetical protein [Intrasporangium sp.]MDN5794460.1 hypothetical protein [Intrasporangium sp.]
MMHAYLRPLRVQHSRGVSVAAGGALSMVGLLAQGVLRFATIWLVGRVAGPVLAGTVAAAIATASLLVLLWPTTAGSAASKYIAVARGGGDTAEIGAVAAHFRRRATLTGILVAALSIPVWVLMQDGRLLDGLCVAVLALAYSGYSFVRGVLFGAQQMARATTWDVASSVLGLLALGAALLAGVGGGALLLPVAGAYALYSLASWPWRLPEHDPLSRAVRRELDHFVALGAVGSLASSGFLQLAMIVARATDPEGAGQFAAAMSTATPASMLAAALSLVLLPSLSEALGSGDRDRFRIMSDRANRVLITVMVATFGSLALGARLVMTILWGHRFAPDSLLFPLLVLALLASNSSVASVNALAARSRRGVLITTLASIAGLLTGVVVWWLFIGRLGVLAVAVGYLVGAVVTNVVPLAAEWRVGAHAWAGLAARSVTAVAVACVGLYVQRAFDISIWLDPVVVAVFLLGWLLASRRDLASLHLRLPGRRPTAR